MSDKPNPGSRVAIDAGCICPILDNHHGRGAYRDDDGNPVFWYTGGCLVHWEETKAIAEELAEKPKPPPLDLIEPDPMTQERGIRTESVILAHVHVWDIYPNKGEFLAFCRQGTCSAILSHDEIQRRLNERSDEDE